MITRVSRLLFLLALLPAAAHAQAPAAPAPAQPYVLKNRSTFGTANDDQRAPFWPIGWTKRKPTSLATFAAPQIEMPKSQFDASTVKVTSILLGTPSLAIINGRSYSEGDYLRQPRTAAAAAAVAAAPRVRIFRINDGNVMLLNQDQVITVALQRPELSQRNGNEELLTEDRP